MASYPCLVSHLICIISIPCAQALKLSPRSRRFPGPARATPKSNASRAAHVKSPSRRSALHTTQHLSQLFNMANGYARLSIQTLLGITDTRNSWSLLVSIIFIVVFCAVAWFASPKGENQTYVYLLVARSHNISSNPRNSRALSARSRLATNTLDRSVWRSTLILSAWSCWLMWGTYPPTCSFTWYIECDVLTFTISVAITFLAQWHPLIAPERSDLRPEYNGGPVASNGMF